MEILEPRSIIAKKKKKYPMNGLINQNTDGRGVSGKGSKIGWVVLSAWSSKYYTRLMNIRLPLIEVLITTTLVLGIIAVPVGLISQYSLFVPSTLQFFILHSLLTETFTHLRWECKMI